MTEQRCEIFKKVGVCPYDDPTYDQCLNECEVLRDTVSVMRRNI